MLHYIYPSLTDIDFQESSIDITDALLDYGGEGFLFLRGILGGTILTWQTSMAPAACLKVQQAMLSYFVSEHLTHCNQCSAL